MTSDLDQALMDRVEELGIKDLLAAFAEALVSTRTSRSATASINVTHANYMVTTLRANTCTCGAIGAEIMKTHRDYRGHFTPSVVPERPHDETCAWSRFLKLFADEKTKKDEKKLVKNFRAWAQRVSDSPDNRTYADVTFARKFLEKNPPDDE